MDAQAGAQASAQAGVEKENVFPFCGSDAQAGAQVGVEKKNLSPCGSIISSEAQSKP